jgi:acetylcholinesterase
MLILFLPFAKIFVLLCTLALCQSSPPCGLTVVTTTGTYTGLINDTTPLVRQFLKMPFALPPIGLRCWLPRTKMPANPAAKSDATNIAPSCPQYLSKNPSIYNQQVPEFLVVHNSQNSTAGAFVGDASEDYLSIAIWTPLIPATKLPVILFMNGGGFGVGGINIPYQLPHHWVQRTQAHIAVTIKSVTPLMKPKSLSTYPSQLLH